MSLVIETSETWMTASIKKKMTERVIMSSRARAPPPPRPRRVFMRAGSGDPAAVDGVGDAVDEPLERRPQNGPEEHGEERNDDDGDEGDDEDVLDGHGAFLIREPLPKTSEARFGREQTGENGVRDTGANSIPHERSLLREHYEHYGPGPPGRYMATLTTRTATRFRSIEMSAMVA